MSPLTETAGDGRVEIRRSVPPGAGDGRLDVVRITSGGDTLHRSRLWYEPVRLPGSAADSLLEGQTALAGRYGVSEGEMAAALRAGLELPEHRPPLRSSHVGRDGSVWMELKRVPDRRRIDAEAGPETLLAISRGTGESGV